MLVLPLMNLRANIAEGWINSRSCDFKRKVPSDRNWVEW